MITLALIRDAAGVGEDTKTIIDALIKLAADTGDGPERERDEREYLEHLPEVVEARAQLANPEPEQGLWSRLRELVRGGSEPSETTTPVPNPTVALDDARQRYAHELLGFITDAVCEWREQEHLRASLGAGGETSRPYRDERSRRGLGPTLDHSHKWQHGR